jgi:hypothetical protein
LQAPTIVVSWPFSVAWNTVGEAPKSLSVVWSAGGTCQLSSRAMVAASSRTSEFESPAFCGAFPVVTYSFPPAATALDQMPPPIVPAGTTQ